MKKLLIILTVLFGSLLLINNASALTSDDGYNYVYFKYDYDLINEKVNTPYFNNIIADIKNKFENSGFSCYIIYFLSNGSVNAFFGNNYIGFQGYGNNSSSVDFSFVTYEQRRVLSYSLETGEKTVDYLTEKVANKAVYEYIFRNINVNTYNNINDINQYFAIYDSNIRIGTDAWSDKFYLFYDLNKNELIPHGGEMPLAKNRQYSKKLKIDVTNLSSIKINFDTKNTNYDDYHFTVLSGIDKQLKEAYYEKSYEWGLCIDANTCYDDYVSRENIYFTEAMNTYSYSSPFKYQDERHGFLDETQDLKYFYIYYDVSDITGNVDLSINSTAPFEIEYDYLENYTDTYVTLNMKGYSGLLIYPIVNNYNGDYPFYLSNANINIYQYYDNKLVGYYKNITSDVYFFNEIENQDRHRYFLIENNNVNEDSYISLNSKYFYYQLIKNTNDSLNITNPNTDEEEYINSLDTSNSMSYNLNSGTEDFISSISNYIKAFFELFSYFFNGLNSYIRNCIIALFTIIIMCAIIKNLRK